MHRTFLFFLNFTTYSILVPYPLSISQLCWSNKPPQLSMTHYNKCFLPINVKCNCISTPGRGTSPWVFSFQDQGWNDGHPLGLAVIVQEQAASHDCPPWFCTSTHSYLSKSCGQAAHGIGSAGKLWESHGNGNKIEPSYRRGNNVMFF